MIQQIYIADYLSAAALQPLAMIETIVAQCPWLLDANWSVRASPPLSLLFQALGAPHSHTMPAGMRMSAVLRATMPAAMQEATFCLLPVHLAMRRDTFSLQAVVPLTGTVYQSLTDRLQAHFAHDFCVLPDPKMRCWWVTPLQAVDALCLWPQDCLLQPAMAWQPQGPHAALIRQWSNEMQMLLHQEASSTEVTDWPEALNSLWFASVEEIPRWQIEVDAIGGVGEVLAGLQATGLPRTRTTSLETMLSDKTLHSALWMADHWQMVDWPVLSTAIQSGQLKALNLVLPFAERSIEVQYKKQLRWQFWQKSPNLPTLLQQLEADLAGQHA